MVDEATLERLKSEHGEVYVITVGDDEDEYSIVVKMPKPAQFEQFTETSEKKPLRAVTTLLRGCLVHPSRTELDALFAARPGLPASFGKAIARLCGATFEADIKKA